MPRPIRTNVRDLRRHDVLIRQRLERLRIEEWINNVSRSIFPISQVLIHGSVDPRVRDHDWTSVRLGDRQRQAGFDRQEARDRPTAEDRFERAIHSTARILPRQLVRECNAQ